MTRTTTRFASLIVVTAALLSCLAVAGTAFGVPGEIGDTSATSSLNTYFDGSTLTTNLLPSNFLGNTGSYWFRVQLSKGDSLSATFTPGIAEDTQAFVPALDGYRDVISSADASGVAHLSFMAPKSTMYNVYFSTSSFPETFTVGSALVSATKFSLGAMSVPSATHSKTFTVAMTMHPAYNGPTCPVKFYVERKVSGHYKSYTTKRNASFYTRTTYSKFTRTLNLPKGTFRVRARFADAAHTTAKYNSWHTFSVK